MIKTPPLLATFVIAAALSSASFNAAEAATTNITNTTSKKALAIGDPAPDLKPAAWLKGEPVTAFDRDKLYIIECWATWCGPCIASIPHINELQRRFQDKGLVIVGINVWDKPQSKAAEFVAKQGDRMSYRVAYDGTNGQVASFWLEAASVGGIPHAFAVREGKLLWHGHPMGLTTNVIEEMLAGKFDVARSIVEEKARLAGVAKGAAYRKAFEEIQKLIEGRNPEAALERIEAVKADLAAVNPASVELLKARTFSELDRAKQALSCFRSAHELAGENASMHWLIAYSLLNKGRVRDHTLALACAQRACTLSQNKVSFYRYTLAQAQHAAGRTAESLATVEETLKQEGERKSPVYNDLIKVRDAVRDGKPWPQSEPAPR